MVYMPAGYEKVGGSSRGPASRTTRRAMLYNKVFKAALLALAAVHTAALTIAGKPNLMIKPYKRNEPLQNVVTWDEV